MQHNALFVDLFGKAKERKLDYFYKKRSVEKETDASFFSADIKYTTENTKKIYVYIIFVIYVHYSVILTLNLANVIRMRDMSSLQLNANANRSSSEEIDD